MPTRAIIQLEDFKLAKVCKYWFGQPEHTLTWLMDFNKKFVGKGGTDDNYKFAQLLRSSAFDCEVYGLEYSRDTGWGVVPFDQSCGAEYCYILKKDGTVKVIEK